MDIQEVDQLLGGTEAPSVPPTDTVENTESVAMTKSSNISKNTKNLRVNTADSNSKSFPYSISS
ncbi:hypothetical protein CROQUDRAFT_101080 [Cronartium quercuum f. sp. fusiforme G11]|uniref:Uncharacterized protein n=1 Tax=Cronartium quercuum f. sp. fusiforme G11 TaxID=708437 RepID=A0A9P6T5K0_9BASI|nr:hypothetical protein CROQUDRAFT_101080 [Cronartium quercuum f. sp. fusiforme G11]